MSKNKSAFQPPTPDEAEPIVGRPNPEPEETPGEDVQPLVRAISIGDLPDVISTPKFSNQEVIDIITDLLSPIANEHLIERAKAIQKFLSE